MKEALVSKGPTGPKVRIVDSPIPEPGEDQILIKVIFSGSNPKDWKFPAPEGDEANSGDDIAGVVAKVGVNVSEFKTGDRVAAFHEMRTPHGSYAEYAIAWKYSTFHLPDHTTFQEASAIPLAALTAAVGLYVDQGLSAPFSPATRPTPLIVYGASSAVGAYAVKLAEKSNIHPIIAVAGSSAPFVETLIDKAKDDAIVDYRDGDDATISALKKAVGSHKVYHAFDAISEHHSNYLISRALQPGATINHVLDWEKNSEISPNIIHTQTSVGRVHKDLTDFGYVISRYFSKGLDDGWFKGHPQKVQPGGLSGVEGALTALYQGKAHGVKYVFRIADTEGVGREKL